MERTHTSVSAEFREIELVNEIRGVLKVIANKAVIPLFLAFWIADLLYVPKFKWIFLLIRLLMVPLCLLVVYLSERTSNYKKLKLLMLSYSILAASGINLMIVMIADPATPYYAGLCMVAIGSLSFMPFTKKEFFVAALAIFGPYITYCSYISKTQSELATLAINVFFVFGSICLCFLVRFFQEGLRLKEIAARLQLKQELENREEIIRSKTDEAVKLTHLSSQFSPQIVESIRQGKIDLDSTGQRAEICSIFIDIVNSTERVTRIDKDKVEKVLSKFLDDTIKILLKYDITIDKFLGDGVLGFCNAPLKRKDYTTRVVHAALEIREKISQDSSFYEKYWQHALEIRVGIAKGFANVGFYGSQRYYKSYTAIGPVVNLASRLCSTAEPMQVVIDNDVFEVVQHDFEMNFLGKKTLKGFHDDIIHTYEVKGSKTEAISAAGQTECPSCGHLLTLETDENGHFVFMCKSCCSVLDSSSLNTASNSEKPASKIAA